MALAFLAIISCSKEQAIQNIKKTTEEPIGDEPAPPDDFDCEYILSDVPSPIYGLLDNPDDPVEEEIDQHLYRIAKALSKFTCLATDFPASFQGVSFDRYGDGMLEIEILDLAAAEPLFESLLLAEFSAAGYDWNTVSGNVQWQGNSFLFTAYLENSPVADWELEPYIGIGTDLDVDDVIGDYIPVFLQEECIGPDYEPLEKMICKVDAESVNALPEPIDYESECLHNPLIIVQIGWEKSKKAVDLGDPDPFTGTVLDTVIDNVPPPGSGCTLGYNYYLKQAGLNGVRFERSKHSEFRFENVSIAVPNTPKDVYVNAADSKKEHLKNVHKRDRKKKWNFNLEIVSTINYNFFGIGPTDGVTPDENCYSCTYEYDWYMFSKKVTFWHYNGIQPKLKLKMKGERDYYQIMNFLPADYCHGEVREFKSPIGRSIVQCKN